jgi:hypothetical protein
MMEDFEKIEKIEKIGEGLLTIVHSFGRYF